MHLPAGGAAGGDRGDLVPGGGLGEEHRRLEVDLHHLVERRLADLGEALLALDADAVDQQVEAPKRAATASTAARIESVDVRVHGDADRVVAGRAAARAASASALAALRPATATRAPASASPQAIASPMPP